MKVLCALKDCIHNTENGRCQSEWINLCNDDKGFYCYEYKLDRQGLEHVK